MHTLGFSPIVWHLYIKKKNPNVNLKSDTESGQEQAPCSRGGESCSTSRSALSRSESRLTLGTAADRRPVTSDISRAVVGVCFCVSVSGCDRGQLQVLSLKSHLGLKTRSVTGTQFTHGFSCLPGKLVPRCTLLSPAALLTAREGEVALVTRG